MSTSLPGIRRRLVCMLYESLVVFSILLIGFLLPQVVLSGFHFELSPRMLSSRFAASAGLFCLVLAQRRTNPADENMENAHNFI